MTGQRPARCAGCGHTEHRKACPRKGPSGCVPFETDGGAAGFACGARPPCPCPFRTCGCGHLVALAVELPAGARTVRGGDEVMIASVERGTAGRPDGLLAVWQLLDGHLAYRDLQPGGQLQPGEWRGTEHTNAQCALLARCEADERWLTLDAA